MSDTERDLLNAVLAFPADDTPRLVLCDHYDETDRAELAEFVRVQIRRSNDPGFHGFLCLPERPCENCEHEKWLFARVVPASIDLTFHAKVWSSKQRAVSFSDGSVHIFYDRGWPNEIHCKLSEFMGGECLCLQNVTELDVETLDGSPPICRLCKGVGRIEGIAKQAALRWPITKITFVDKDCQTGGGGIGWYSHSMTGWPIEGDDIPAELFNLLEDYYTTGPYQERADDGYKWYHTRDKATKALSEASVRYMRKLANLPELTHAQ